MGQQRLHYSTKKQEAELLYQQLECAFEEDSFPLAITEINEAEEIYEISIYIDDEDLAVVLQKFANIINIPENDIKIEKLPDIDWVKHSLEGLKPVRAGRFFVYGSHDRSLLQPNDLGIEIEAGQAFGTGHHGTTAGCLEMITSVMQKEQPQNILDLGTGSGVLAIGMAKLSNVQILATDIDPIATKVAQENIILNGVADHVIAATASGFDSLVISERAPFDLIVANILARPLIELSPQMFKNMKQGGSIILSGILNTQHDSVLEAYLAQGFKHHETYHRDEWVTIHLK